MSLFQKIVTQEPDNTKLKTEGTIKVNTKVRQTPKTNKNLNRF